MWDEDSPFNFARTSTRDEIVHGAARPGYGSGSRVAVEVVDEWIELMVSNQILHVLCLLSPEELAAYDDLLARYRRRFSTVTHVPLVDLEVPSEEALAQALEAVAEAERRGEPILVHCAAGIGRTGIVTSAWLRVRYALGVKDAIAEVRKSAEDAGAFRDPLETNETEVQALLGSARLAK